MNTATLRPKDFGPIYRETDMTRFPVEPFNTYSNLIFLFVIVYWAKKLRFRSHPFLTSCISILSVGFFGGIIYHATRNHNLWLYLDFIPIVMIAAGVCIYLWYRILSENPTVFRQMGVAFLLLCGIAFSAAKAIGNSITMGYLLLALCIVTTALIHCRLKNWLAFRSLFSATLFFALAIGSRTLDAYPEMIPLPMGTHFLWHIFGGLSTFLLIRYLYLTETQ